VLDPVGAGATRFRDDAIRQLLRHRPTVIRGNASEIMAVARAAGLTQAVATPHGVDSAHSTDEALGLATALARHCFCVVAATGPVDIVTDGERVARIANGSPLMARVTALGCALSGVAGACLAVSDDAFEATVAALGLFAVAGERAAEGGEPVGPGTFRVRLLDRLDDLSPHILSSRMKVTA
jgi:hydroxyethylthiazole kinase